MHALKFTCSLGAVLAVLPPSTALAASPPYSVQSCAEADALHRARILADRRAGGDSGNSVVTWSPRTSVNIRYFAAYLDEPRQWLPGRLVGESVRALVQADAPTAGVFPSPDGRYVFTLELSGELGPDVETHILRIFDVDQISTALGQRNPVSIGSAACGAITFRGPFRNANAITDVEWTPDSRALLFRGALGPGADRNGHYEAFRYDLASRRLEQLTETPNGIGWFTFRGGSIIYRLWRVDPKYDPRATFRYPMDAVDRLPDGTVTNADLRGYDPNDPQFSPTFSTAPAGHGSHRMEDFDGVSISPNGQWAVTNVAAQNQFTLWRLTANRAPQRIANIADVRSNEVRVRSSGLDRARTRIFWTSDSKRVLFVGALDPRNRDASNAASGRVIASLDVEHQSWEVLRPVRTEDLAGVTWSNSFNRLAISGQGRGVAAPTSFDWAIDHWAEGQASGQAERSTDDLRIFIRQGENDPPVVIAASGGREVPLTPPDPALEHVRRATVRDFSWRDFDGVTRTGGLMLPPGASPGQQFPLVIQPYYYVPELFLPDGYHRGADAAQFLAARGIAVLMINSVLEDGSALPAELGPAMVRRVDAIVDAMVAQGIADPERVAVQGFSRGGFETYYIVSHPGRTRLAAAGMTDSWTGGIAASIGGGGFNSSRAFWENPAYSLTNDTTLNADLIATPALFTRHLDGLDGHLDYNAGMSGIDTVGAFVRNRKPVEYYYLPFATHSLRRPAERAALMGAMTDWMSFWLTGYEDPSPDKAAQYRRWHMIRDNWAAANAGRPDTPQNGFIRTRAGLGYRILDRRVGEAPTTGDTVTVSYRVQGDAGQQARCASPTGTAAIRLPEPPTLLPVGILTLDRDTRPNQGVGKGWDQGLRLLHQGERAVFVMSPDIAQLPGDTLRCSAGATPLSIEVEVIGIRRGAATPTGSAG